MGPADVVCLCRMRAQRARAASICIKGTKPNRILVSSTLCIPQPITSTGALSVEPQLSAKDARRRGPRAPCRRLLGEAERGEKLKVRRDGYLRVAIALAVGPHHAAAEAHP